MKLVHTGRVEITISLSVLNDVNIRSSVYSRPLFQVCYNCWEKSTLSVFVQPVFNTDCIPTATVRAIIYRGKNHTLHTNIVMVRS